MSRQYNAVKSQLIRNDVNEIIIATDAGREGELVARWIIAKAKVNKPIKRLWISSVTDKAIKEGETATEEEINAFCEGLPRYKRPKKVIFEKVPRNPTGKIEKPVLREKYCNGKMLVEAQIEN